MDLRSVDKICLFPGQSRLFFGQGLNIKNIEEVRQHGRVAVNMDAMSMTPGSVRLTGLLPGLTETLKLFDNNAWIYKNKDIDVQVGDAVVNGEFVVIAGGDWTPMKAGLRGTPQVKNIDAINRRGIIEVKVEGNKILVRGNMTSSSEDGNDVKETISWWDDNFSWLTPADVVNVTVITCGLQPGVERDFVRMLASTVSEDIKQSSAIAKSCSTLPSFCDEDLLTKIEQALKGIDKQGRIKWNLVFKTIKENDYIGGMNRLLEQLEFCLRSTEKKAVEELIKKAKEIIAKRRSQLNPNSKTYRSHVKILELWEENLLKRLERLRDNAQWS